MTQTNWPELIVRVKATDCDKAADLCEPFCGSGLMIEDLSDLVEGVKRIAHIDLIDEDLLEKDRNHSAIHLYFDTPVARAEAKEQLSFALQEAGILAFLEENEVHQEDWVDVWKQYYHPRMIGEKLLLCPSWELEEPKKGVVRMVLDPGMAFGTGSHETTRLCMELLQTLPLEGGRMLDVGCGSGILAICALLLGAKSAVGCDIDPLAVQTAAENAARNGFADRSSFVCGSLTQGIEGKYEVICANIVADVVMMLLPDVEKFLTPGGTFIASGILDIRFDEVKKAAEEVGLKLDVVRKDGCWIAFSARF